MGQGWAARTCAVSLGVTITVFHSSHQSGEKAVSSGLGGPLGMGSGLDPFHFALISSVNPHCSKQHGAIIIPTLQRGETETQGLTQLPADTKKPSWIGNDFCLTPKSGSLP